MFRVFWSISGFDVGDGDGIGDGDVDVDDGCIGDGDGILEVLTIKERPVLLPSNDKALISISYPFLIDIALLNLFQF